MEQPLSSISRQLFVLELFSLILPIRVSGEAATGSRVSSRVPTLFPVFEFGFGYLLVVPQVPMEGALYKEREDSRNENRCY